MSKGTILVVEPDDDIRNMLRIYFGGQGYQAEFAANGRDALLITGKRLPHLIVLDVDLPDIHGYEVCRLLRTNRRTSHIPIIFLTQASQYSDRMTSIELGSDDFLTKPFDIEEMNLRILNQIQQSARGRSISAISGLAASSSIEQILRNNVNRDSEWHYIDLKVEHFASFIDVYGIQAGDFLQRELALLMNECLDLFGKSDDFVGHTSSDNFVFVSEADTWLWVLNNLLLRANALFLRQYRDEDKLRGALLVKGQTIPFMSLSYGVFAASEHPVDISYHQIVPIAVEDREKHYRSQGLNP